MSPTRLGSPSASNLWGSSTRWWKTEGVLRFLTLQPTSMRVSTWNLCWWEATLRILKLLLKFAWRFFVLEKWVLLNLVTSPRASKHNKSCWKANTWKSGRQSWQTKRMWRMQYRCFKGPTNSWEQTLLNFRRKHGNRSKSCRDKDGHLIIASSHCISRNRRSLILISKLSKRFR